MLDGGRLSRKGPVSFYVLFLWISASAISRGHGFWFFVVGLGPLAVALIAARRGYPCPLLGLVAVAFGLTIALLVVETLLHLRPESLSGHVTYTGYDWQRGGIYRLDEHLGPDLQPDIQSNRDTCGGSGASL